MQKIVPVTAIKEAMLSLRKILLKVKISANELTTCLTSKRSTVKKNNSIPE